MIDSGVDYTHPDLYLNVWLNQGELPPVFTDPANPSMLTDADANGLITFHDLNDPVNAGFVTDLNANGYIDADDLLNDPQWADGIDTDGNSFEDDLIGWDFVENDNRPFDEHGHGTHVAGILGAAGNNAAGIAGVAWDSSIMPLRFLNENNRGEISGAVEAINYGTLMRTRAVNPVNLRVSNNSWGVSGSFSQTLFDAVEGNRAADILFVAAAGNGDILGGGLNNDDNPFYPASFLLGNVISVAAQDDRGALAEFSNFGSTSVDIAAPGVGILSLKPGTNTITRSGTSMATPHVPGVPGLVLDQFPEATAIEVRDAILTGAVSNAALTGQIAGDRSLNAVGAVTATTFAPVPGLIPVTAVMNGDTATSVTVTYTDDGSVDDTTLDERDIEITRKGFSETLLKPVSATDVTGMDGLRTVQYVFNAPGGTWDATENGTWTISLREGEVQDNLSLYSAPRALGSFTVNISDPNVIFVNTTLDTIDADPNDGKASDGQLTAEGVDRVSLRAAIMHAGPIAAPTIVVIPAGVYTLSIPGQEGEDIVVPPNPAIGDLDLTSTSGITLLGAGAFSTIIDAQ
ncbi:MAG: S8 family peptidase, partial [Planctomycetaceae bacterium]